MFSNDKNKVVSAAILCVVVCDVNKTSGCGRSVFVMIQYFSAFDWGKEWTNITAMRSWISQEKSTPFTQMLTDCTNPADGNIWTVLLSSEKSTPFTQMLTDCTNPADRNIWTVLLSSEKSTPFTQMLTDCTNPADRNIWTVLLSSEKSTPFTQMLTDCTNPADRNIWTVLLSSEKKYSFYTDVDWLYKPCR